MKRPRRNPVEKRTRKSRPLGLSIGQFGFIPCYEYRPTLNGNVGTDQQFTYYKEESRVGVREAGSGGMGLRSRSPLPRWASGWFALGSAQSEKLPDSGSKRFARRTCASPTPARVRENSRSYTMSAMSAPQLAADIVQIFDSPARAGKNLTQRRKGICVRLGRKQICLY